MEGREVAIKQFHLGAEIPDLEFALLSSLRHRNIPRGHELFFENEHWHIVMDPVFGDDLRAYRSIHGGIVQVSDVREIGVQLCSALDELHSNGVLYRDLKPANVVREPSGRVRLVDMGSACTDYRNDAYVTPPYASPEQRLRCESIDERADIYSLGVVLFELLTGQSHFDMAPMQDRVSEDVRTVLLSMCSQNPAERPYCMLEVIRLLLRV